MLEANIVNRIREYLAAELAPRDRALEMALMAEQSAAAAAGGLGNSRTVFRYTGAGRNELAVRSGIVWTVIRRSHSSLNGTFSDWVLDDLRQQINEHMTAQTRRVADICAQRLGPDGRTKEQFRETVEKEVLERGRQLAANLDIEAQFYVDELKRAGVTQPAGTVLNFNAPVGAVQTAPFATANVSLAGAEGGRLVEALEALRQAIERSTDGTSEQRAAGTEIVVDAITAVKAEKPNALKIGGLLSALATTVQTTASLQPAYQMLKAAASAVGIPLP